jgi:hypothetical protein
VVDLQQLSSRRLTRARRLHVYLPVHTAINMAKARVRSGMKVALGLLTPVYSAEETQRGGNASQFQHLVNGEARRSGGKGG